MVFSTGLGDNGEPFRELVPMGPAKTTVPRMKSEIPSCWPTEGTGLYATLRAAQKKSLATLDPDRINAIVLLSDGRNEYPPDTDLNGLLDDLSAESVDTSGAVFTIGYGEAADTEALQKIAEASRGQYYEANDPTSIERVLTSVCRTSDREGQEPYWPRKAATPRTRNSSTTMVMNTYMMRQELRLERSSS